MRSPFIIVLIVVILTILLAAPLLGALITNGSIVGMAGVWIAVGVLLVVTVVVSIVRVARVRRNDRDKAA